MEPTQPRRRSKAQKTPLVLVLCLAVTAPAFGETPVAPGGCTLRLTLYNQPFDDESSLPEIPLDFDANIAIRGEIGAVLAGECGLSPGDRVVFLIHSPARTFGGTWFDGREFFFWLETASPASGRRWRLADLDWPLETVRPGLKYLVCAAGSTAVRAMVGTSDDVVGSLTVFRDDVPLVSLDPLEVARLGPSRSRRSLEIELSGTEGLLDLRFSVEGTQGALVMDERTTELSCEWPDE